MAEVRLRWERTWREGYTLACSGEPRDRRCARGLRRGERAEGVGGRGDGGLERWGYAISLLEG